MRETAEDAGILLWEANEGRVFMTDGGSLGIDVGGKIVVMRLSEWINAAWPSLPFGGEW